MKKIKENIKKFFTSRYTIITFIIITMYLIYIALCKITPFGENTILKSDSYKQYVNFFCYYREVLINGKSLMVSWNLGLGNCFLTTFAYYLASPLNLLVVFFKPENMYIFVELLLLIKIILIGNFMVLFLSKSYEYKKKDSILFGLMYAFSAYVMCYGFHIMWLDAVYMLPIVLMLVDKYIRENKIYPYILALGYTIFVNYYVGYIVAFFSGIYYLVKYYINIDGKIFTLENMKEFAKSLIKFLFGIAISFGLTMILFVPSFMQSSGNIIKSKSQLFDFDIDKIRLFSNVIFNNYNYMFTQKSCLVFTSTMALVLLPTYYFNKKINRKEKIGFSCIIVFLLLPIVSPFLYKIWHCFAKPNCFNYRYSFTLMITLIIMTFRAYQNKSEIKKSHMFISLGIFILLNIIEIVIKLKGYLTSDGYEISYVSIIISCAIYLIMWTIMFLQIKYIKKEKLLTTLLIIITIVDLLIGANSSTTNNDKYFSKENVTQHDSAIEKLLKHVENKETDRIIFIPDNYGNNMSLKYGYSNIGFFTSSRNRETIKNMYKLGYNIQRDEELWITSYSGTYFNYDLAGVKYYITQEPLEDNEVYGFELIDTVDDYYMYENKNTIPFGYYIKENVLEAENPFEMQNKILSQISNQKDKDEQIEEYMKPIEKNDGLVELEKKSIDNNEEVRWKYKVKAKKDINIYIYSDWNLQLYKEGQEQFEKYADFWSTETGIKGIKHLNENENYEFEIGVNKDEYSPEHPIYIYVSDNKKIEKIIQDINKNDSKFELKSMDKNTIKGKATVNQEGYLCLPIAYDDGWRAKVNGKTVNVDGIYNVYTGIKLSEGTYDIELYFIPRGFKMGIILTMISIFALVIVIIKEKNIYKI